MVYPIISSQTLRDILNAVKNGKKQIEISLDLGYSNKKEKVELFEEGIILEGNKIKINNIREDDKSCYIIKENELEKVQYSGEGGIYKLIPTSFRPIMQISGTSMHKQPFIELVEKYKLKGKILDAGTGLGYTAIAASKKASEVITIEIDESVRDMQKLNPYSSLLFSSPNIKAIQGDLVEEIKNFEDQEFDFVILDGGTPRASGEFFSQNNYNQAFRVLKKGGKLYHYVPNYHEKRGVDFQKKIMGFMAKAGFRIIRSDKIGSYVVGAK